MRALALLPLAALTACTPAAKTTENILVERGLTQPSVSAEPWLLGPCDWSEPYTAHFAGRFNGRVVTGTLCATSENLDDARLLDLREARSQRGQS